MPVLPFHSAAKVLGEKDPQWKALKNIYDSTEGSFDAKTKAVSRFVAQFTIAKVLFMQDNNSPEQLTTITRKLVGDINEIYPFDVADCLNTVERGIRLYNQFKGGLSEYSVSKLFLEMLTNHNPTETHMQDDVNTQAWYALSDMFKQEEE